MSTLTVFGLLKVSMFQSFKVSSQNPSRFKTVRFRRHLLLVTVPGPSFMPATLKLRNLETESFALLLFRRNILLAGFFFVRLHLSLVGIRRIFDTALN
jgi:hypothetical protein